MHLLQDLATDPVDGSKALTDADLVATSDVVDEVAAGGHCGHGVVEVAASRHMDGSGAVVEGWQVVVDHAQHSEDPQQARDVAVHVRQAGGTAPGTLELDPDVDDAQAATLGGLVVFPHEIGADGPSRPFTQVVGVSCVATEARKERHVVVLPGRM